jgi:LacI family transcriptional regulator
MARATINDVAELAAVSIKTVSRVVNGEPNVHPSTREKVQKAIAKLNYRPNPSARNLASDRARLIGLIYDDPSAYEIPSAGYVIRMQQGALRACKASSYELLIHPCNYRSRAVCDELRTLIDQFRPAGIVIAAPLSNMPRIVRAVADTGTALVRLSPGGSGTTGQCSVSTTDRAASAEMTRYLASLGHERIAFIKGHPNHKAVAGRWLGYREGLLESGLEVSEDLVIAGDNSFGSGEACGMKLLKRKHRPTAIFAANDDMAAGVIRVADRLGVRIPDELSVAGCDDIALAQQVYPALTTIRQPFAEMAERAATTLISHTRRRQALEGEEIIAAELIVRDSTGPVSLL